MSELRDKRVRFTLCLGILVNFIMSRGYECAIAPDGETHMTGSLHFVGLAKDFAIYKDGEYLKTTEDYEFAGKFWKSLSPDFRWGGDFMLPDGNHFSCTYQGKA